MGEGHNEGSRTFSKIVKLFEYPISCNYSNSIRYSSTLSRIISDGLVRRLTIIFLKLLILPVAALGLELHPEVEMFPEY